MKGFILAGGKGTRLYPLTKKTPKPLLKVKGKSVLTHLVNLFLKNEISDIAINIPKRHQSKFDSWQAKNFPDSNINFLVEESPSGTLNPLKNYMETDLIVSNGDELKDINIKDMYEWHNKNKAIATVGLIKVKNPKNYGIAVLDDQKIIKFLEKPSDPPSEYINSGIYILSPKAKNYFPDRCFAMLETDLFPLLAEKRKLHGYKWSGKWQDIGTPERYKKAQLNW